MMSKKVENFNEFWKSLNEVTEDVFIKDKTPINKETIVRQLKEIILNGLETNQAKLILEMAKTISKEKKKQIQ